MARIIDITSLNKKILDTEEKVLLIKNKYDLAIAELEELQDNKKELQQKILLTAIEKVVNLSMKSYVLLKCKASL